MSRSSQSPIMDDHAHHLQEDSGLQVVPGQETTIHNSSTAHFPANEKIPSYPGNGDFKWDYQSSGGSSEKGYYGTPPRESSYPEVIATSGQKPVFDGESPYPHYQTNPPQKRILGLRRRWFFAILAVLLILIALGVGLGVYFGRRINRTEAANSSAADPAAEATPTSTSPSVTTETIALPSATLLSDCPSSNNTIHSVDVNGQTFEFRKACGVSLYNPADPMANVTGSAMSLDECINRCASANSGGSTRCDRVCWKNSKATAQAGGAGNCFGYIGTNTTDTNQVTGDFSGTTNCDGAFLIHTEGTSNNSG